MHIAYSIPVDKIYAVVDLEKDGESYSCVTPSIWLHDVTLIECDDKITKAGFCYYPKDESKLSDFVEKRRKPDLKGDKWTAYKVTILKLCQTYKDAKTYSEAALNNELLSSSGTEKDIISKRQPVPKVMFDPSTAHPNKRLRRPLSSSDEDEYEHESRKRKTDSSEEDEEYDITTHRNQNTEGDTPNTPSPAAAAPAATPAAAAPAATPAAAAPAATPAAAAPASTPAAAAPASTPAAAAPAATPAAAAPAATPAAAASAATPAARPQGSKQASAGCKGGFSTGSGSGGPVTPRKRSGHPQHRLASPKSPKGKWPYKRNIRSDHRDDGNGRSAQEISAMYKMMHEMDLKLDKIFLCVCPAIEQVNALDDSTLPPLPIPDLDAEKDFIAYIADTHNSIIMTKHLAKFGSTVGRRQSVYSILPKLLSNKLAATYNFKGRNKAGAPTKRAFEKSKLYTLFRAALKRFASKMEPPMEINDKDLQNDVMCWLKDAPKRYKNELAAQEVDSEHDGDSVGADEDLGGDDRHWREGL